MRLLAVLVCALLFAACASNRDTAPARTRWRHLSSAAGDLPSPGPSDQQTGSLIADVDHNGMNDFFVAARVVGPAITLFLKTPDGWRKHIVEPDFLRIEAGGAAHDVDGDGDIDVVFGNDAGGNKIWWWENPSPNLRPSQRWARHRIKSSGHGKHHDQLFGDFDQDGKAELVSWNQQANALLMYEIPQNPKADKDWPSRVIYTWEGEEHEGLAASDIDLDGDPDIVGGGRWYEHTGGGSFTPHLIDDRFRFSRTATGQLVVGGRPEVVLAPGDADGRIRFYEWRDGAWIGQDLPNPDLVHGHSLGVGDVDRDGNLDIFSAEMGQWGTNPGQQNAAARLRLFYGDGSGKFIEQVVATGFGNHESRLADLDGDGDLDILGKPYNWETPRIDVWINESPAREELPLDRWSTRD